MFAFAGISVDFVSTGYLILLALLPLIFYFSRRSMSGLDGQRRWIATGLRCLAFLFIVLALARVRILK
ncbi:MAG: hypothetical protein AAF517_01830 [Planctomycetota bacterium]